MFIHGQNSHPAGSVKMSFTVSEKSGCFFVLVGGNSFNLHTPLCKTSTFQASYFSWIVKLWNYVCKLAPPTSFCSPNAFQLFVRKLMHEHSPFKGIWYQLPLHVDASPNILLPLLIYISSLWMLVYAFVLILGLDPGAVPRMGLRPVALPLFGLAFFMSNQ